MDNWDLVKEPSRYVLQPDPRGVANCTPDCRPQVTYVTFNKLSVSCTMDFLHYPFDMQVLNEGKEDSSFVTLL